MKGLYHKLTAKLPNERGQTMVMVVLTLGLFLLGAVGFGVDIANLWFHRQAAQTAADAACTAGAMDLLENANGGSAPSSGSWAWMGGSGIDCGGHSSGRVAYAPCWYAAQNGYNGAGLVSGSDSNQVTLRSPSSVSGISTCSASTPSGQACLPSYVSNPLLQVNIDDRVKVYFAGMISGSRTMDVGAQAVCGVVAVQSVPPMLVLDSTGSLLSLSVLGDVAIYGGPQTGFQVNSSSALAVSIPGALNLSHGGPSGTGSNFGLTGAASSIAGLILGSGQLLSPDAPASDPFAQVCAPGQGSDCLTPVNGYAAPPVPGNSEPSTGVGTVGAGTDGCPPSGRPTCEHFVAGYYANGIQVINHTAVFDPGLYYVLNGMTLGLNSLVRPGTFAGDGSGGTTFYFADASSVSVAATSGNSAGQPFFADSLKCSGGETLPSNVPLTLEGNVLLGPCRGYYGDPLGTSDPAGEQRGILFFQNRSQAPANPPQWGGAAFALAGSLYFHDCASGVTGGGELCDSAAAAATLTLNNLCLSLSANTDAYVLGDIVTDALNLSLGACMNVNLNPSPGYYMLKASLLQ